MQLKLQSARFGNVMVIRCDGRIVAGEEVQALEAAIEGISLETRQIVLNLAQMNFLDSGGLGALVRFTRVLRRNHGDMVLSDLNPFVVHALEATNLHVFFSDQRVGSGCGASVFPPCSGLFHCERRTARARRLRPQIDRPAGIYERPFAARRV